MHAFHARCLISLSCGLFGSLLAVPPQAVPAEAGWSLVREDDFNRPALDPSWYRYDGPGHAGEGVRSPEQINVVNGVLHIDGTADGTTGGMSWNAGQRYGRWETRARYAPGTAAYHQVLTLWPDAEDFPEGGEVDYSEVSDQQRQNLEFFLHFGSDNDQVSATRPVDTTQWHVYAVEWTPDHIVGYVDGVEFFRSQDPATFPPRPMHPTIQLDWFPGDGPRGPGSMEVDWIRQYALRG